MATLSVQAISPAGVGPTYAAAAGGGDNFAPDSNTFLHVKNGGGSSITVTVATPGLLRGQLSIGDSVVSVPNAGERMIGPFPADLFGDPANSGLAAVTYTGVTSVTVGAFKAAEF